jgi:hypothetical protein
MTTRRACVDPQYVTELAMLKYRLLKKPVQKVASVESHITGSLVVHQIQQRLILSSLCFFCTVHFDTIK